MSPVKIKSVYIAVILAAVFLVGFSQSVLFAQNGASLITLEMSEGNYIDLLEAETADIRDVMSELSRRSDFNIIVNDNIQGNVSIFLTDIEIRDALRIILDRLELAFSEETMDINGQERNIIQVMSRGEFEAKFGFAFGQEMQTRIIPLVYINSEEIHSILEALKSQEGKIIFNKETKTFVLMDEPKILDSMEEVIKKLDVPMDSREFILNTQNINEVREEIEKRLTKNVGSVEINTEKNSIVVTDTLLKIQEIERVISDLDLAGNSIQVDVKVIQITLSDEHEMGVDWEAIVSNYQDLKFMAFDTEQVLTSEKGLLSFGTISEEDLNILTEALETVGEIKTVFVDQYTVENRKEIDFAIHVEAVSSVEKRGAADSYLPTKDDIRFYLNPEIIQPEGIHVKINPAKYRIADQDIVKRKRQNILMRGVSRGADLIRSATRVIPGIGDGSERIREGDLVEEKFGENVTLNVQDGSTVVIGAMIKEVYVKSLRKIPLLGDLPFFGFAFQSEGEQLRNTEVIVFLTIKKVAE